MDESLWAAAGRQTCFLVDLDLVAANFADMRRIVGPGVKIAAVLKADAYGHGALPVAGILLASGAELLAVATLSEALELRAAYPDAPLLVMGHTPDWLMMRAAAAGIRTTVFDVGNAAALSEAALSLGKRAMVHVKLDTGMNRLGIKAYENPAGVVERIAGLPGIEIEGIFSHLALRDRASDLAQFALYREILAACEARGLSLGLRHVCDSIGAVRYPEFRLDMVRVGAAFFGVRPMRMGPEYDAYPFPQPGSFLTRIARLRRLSEGEMVSYDDSWRSPPGGSLVATLPVGYADGYPRRFGNAAQVLVRGVRAPVVGLVCMDQAMVDVSGVEAVAEGDEVLLFGGEGIPLGEAAAWGGTNRNEILCGVGRRVPRVYLKAGKPWAADQRLSGSTLRLLEGDR